MGAEVFLRTEELHFHDRSSTLSVIRRTRPALNGTEDINYPQGLSKRLATSQVRTSPSLWTVASEFFGDGIYDYTKFEGDHGVKRMIDEQVEFLSQLVEAPHRLDRRWYG